MKKIEGFLFPKANQKQEKYKRPVSLVLTLLLLILLIAVIFGLIIPELGSSFVLLKDNVIRFLDTFEEQHPAFLNEFVAMLPTAEELKAINWEELANKTIGFLGSGAGSFINSTVNVASRIFSGLFTFFMGFVFSIYLLVQKETMARQARKLLYAYLPEDISDRIVSIAKLANRTFSSFLSGQCLEAVVLGLLFFIVMTVFRFPYALMISVLIAVSALIPVFGAFIGCVVGAFMILMTDGLMKMLWFIAVFLVLQQLEGNLIYPKVVGNSVGLPSIWVFAAVSIGGSAFGVVGMLVFIPLCSVLYALLKDSVNLRLKERKISKKKIN
jgi:predicted PurR-regulated permease PerM